MISWCQGVSVMTFEERLERLLERHEALAQTVELQGHRIDQLIAATQQDAENIRALARIAEIHEHRLTHLEDE
jgi:hypothetical protein